MMHPQFRLDLIHEQSHRLDQSARRAIRFAPGTPAGPTDEAVALRLCTVHDGEALERLAALEGRPLPAGCLVLAEVNGRVVAAFPLDGGQPLADPFRRTEHILPLLRLRASQLNGDQPRLGLEAAKAIAARMLQAAR